MKKLILLLALSVASVQAQDVELLVTGSLSPGIASSSKFTYSFGVGALRGDRAVSIDVGVAGKEKPDRVSVGLSPYFVFSRLGFGIGPEVSIVPDQLVGLRVTALSNAPGFLVGVSAGRFSGIGLWTALRL